MRKKTKSWIVTAFLLVLIGGVLFAGAMFALGWDFTKLSTVEYETNTYDVTDAYRNVTVITDTADVTFVPSETAGTSVVCYEEENLRHAVMVNEDTLVIELNDTRKWYEHIGIGFGKPTVTVYVPQGDYAALCVKASTADVTVPKEFSFSSIDVRVSTGDVINNADASGILNIKTSTGDIRLASVSTDTLNLSVSTGDIKATDVRCQQFQSCGDTGDIFLKNVIATESLSAQRGTGDVTFDGCDAADIVVTTDTGDVKGDLLTDKVFVTQTDTGRVHVPNTTAGGRCEIITTTGDIHLSIY